MQQTGATIGCYVPQCSVNLHYHCAVLSGWDFENLSSDGSAGRNFFCEKHRANASWQVREITA